MAADPHVAEALRRIRSESDALCAELDGLAPDNWERVTACDPWTVKVVAGHLLASVEPYLHYIQAGLQGRLATYQSREARAQRIMDCAALEPATLVAELRAATDRFEQALSGVAPRQADRPAIHSTGRRPVRWYVDQRLAEVAFHRRDVNRAVGRPFELDEATAAFLLPMLVESNLPGFVARDKGGGHGRYALAVRGGPTWHLEFAPGSVAVTRDGTAAVDATFEGDAVALGLFLYGRFNLAELEATGRLTVRGDRAAAERFRGMFRGP